MEQTLVLRIAVLLINFLTNANSEFLNITNSDKVKHFNVTVLSGTKEFMDIINANGTEDHHVPVLIGAKDQCKYISVNESTGDVYKFRDKDMRYVHRFHSAKPSIRGVWVEFQNRDSQELGWATRTSNGEGGNCTIMHSVDERNRLVKNFTDRNLAEDNLIMISIMTYVNELNLDIRIGNEEYEGYVEEYLPLPFAFLKGDFERDYKYLPIRLHQFRPLAQLQIEHHIKENYYEITQPRKETIRLNISGECWRNISVFTDKASKTHIGPFSPWVKNTIIAHLIQVLHDITSKLKDDQGLIWRDHFMKDVCYVERREKGRYSVPFHLRECCAYTRHTIGDFRYSLPLECRMPGRTFEDIRKGILIIIFIMFGFTPLLLYITPSKPRPYIKLRKEGTNSLEMENSQPRTKIQYSGDDNGQQR